MIHHVQLACPPGTEDALRAFYAGVLGLPEIAKPPALAARGGCWFRGSWFRDQNVELHIGVEPDFRPARKAHPGLLVPDLDEMAQRLRAAGYPVIPDDDFPGMRRFYTEDPHGNRLEFLQPVSPVPSMQQILRLWARPDGALRGKLHFPVHSEVILTRDGVVLSFVPSFHSVQPCELL